MTLVMGVRCERTRCKSALWRNGRPADERIGELALRLHDDARRAGWRTTDDPVDLCPEHADGTTS